MAFPAPGTTLGSFRVRKLFLGNLPDPAVRAHPGAQPTLLHFQKDSFLFLRIRRSSWHEVHHGFLSAGKLLRAMGIWPCSLLPEAGVTLSPICDQYTLPVSHGRLGLSPWGDLMDFLVSRISAPGVLI